jgi:hypothetical protein
MMNINCSEKCIYEENGKCTLNHVTPLSNLFSTQADCAYFNPKEINKKAPQK